MIVATIHVLMTEADDGYAIPTSIKHSTYNYKSMKDIYKIDTTDTKEKGFPTDGCRTTRKRLEDADGNSLLPHEPFSSGFFCINTVCITLNLLARGLSRS